MDCGCGRCHLHGRVAGPVPNPSWGGTAAAVGILAGLGVATYAGVTFLRKKQAQERPRVEIEPAAARAAFYAKMSQADTATAYFAALAALYSAGLTAQAPSAISPTPGEVALVHGFRTAAASGANIVDSLRAIQARIAATPPRAWRKLPYALPAAVAANINRQVHRDIYRVPNFPALVVDTF